MGADISIIAQKKWPPEWPMAPSMVIVTGVCGQQIPWQSAKELHVIGPEGKSGTLLPYVLLIPGTLLG